ncbi:unnamed protein product [Calicophoron daubneyi]|uniref:Uncharacterized protein n=1 Tax=Calicophoron daubneyi TaxID=300641 RepID=A0AAV2T6J4_CALDB
MVDLMSQLPAPCFMVLTLFSIQSTGFASTNLSDIQRQNANFLVDHMPVLLVTFGLFVLVVSISLALTCRRRSNFGVSGSFVKNDPSVYLVFPSSRNLRDSESDDELLCSGEQSLKMNCIV